MQTFEPIPYQPPSWALKGVSQHAVPTHRIPLGRLNTPIHRWNVPGIPSDGPEIYIKRDDLTGLQLSGNKIRKLEFILAQAKTAGHDSIITLGGIQSNHARATAVAASYIGLETHLILRTSRALADSDPGLAGNLLVERLIGAHLHLVTKEEYTRVGQAALSANLCEKLQSQGLNPYVIPVGGSSALGTWGYLSFMDELKHQMEQNTHENNQVPQFTDIAMACGSGGTTAGIALGNYLSGLHLRVSAYMVCDDQGYFEGYIDNVFKELGATPEKLRNSNSSRSNHHDGKSGGESFEKCGDRGPTATNLIRFIQAKGQGYALSRQEELQTVLDVAITTSIVLDPVYTGKAIHALIEEIKKNPREWTGRKILFIHTGGLLGLYDAAPQLQPLIEAAGKVHRMHVP
jgi:D-cysteine desulfhydrase family pyridoxal phosphate-dependent enzyme